MTHPNYETYLSPFTWRYGSQGMRQVWSEAAKRHLRRIWVALAEVQAEYGLVQPEQVADLRRAHGDGGRAAGAGDRSRAPARSDG